MSYSGANSVPRKETEKDSQPRERETIMKTDTFTDTDKDKILKFFNSGPGQGYLSYRGGNSVHTPTARDQRQRRLTVAGEQSGNSG